MPFFSPPLDSAGRLVAVPGVRTKGAVACLVLFAVLLAGCGRSATQYIARGNQLFSSGKYDDAILNYRNAIKKDPKSGEAYYRLALALLRTNKTPEGYQSLLHAVELSPNNLDAKVELANLSLTAYAQNPAHPASFYNQVVKLSDQLLAANANSPEGLRLKGAIAALDNHMGDAVNYFRRALQAAPGKPDIQTTLAGLLLRDNQPEEGERLAKDAIAHHPDYGPAYDLLYQQYVLGKRWDDAESLLKLRIANNPKDGGAVVRLAGFYAARQKPEDAEKTIDTLVSRHDAYPDGDLLAGDFHTAERSYDKALADYQRGLSRDKSRENLYQLRSAAVLSVQGRRDEGLKTVDALLAKEPKDVNARALKISILLEQRGAENISTAAALAADLAKDTPANPRVQMLAAQAAVAKGDLDAATARLQQAAKIEPQSIAPPLALARVQMLRKNYPAMLEQADTALKINSRDQNARLYRVMALTGNGSLAAAKAEAEQLAKDTSNARQVEMQLGIIALNQKKYADAEQYFQKLYNANGQDVSPLAGLVSTLMAENNSSRALSILQEQEKRAPDSMATQALTAATAQAAGKLDLALSELQKIASENPKSADVQIRIGELQRRRGDLNAAIAAYERARDLDPKRKGIDAAIASAQDETGDKAGAIASYRKALAETPDNPLVMNNLAYLLAETGGDLNEANRLATAGMRKVPDNPSLQDTLGWIEVKQGNTSAALNVFSSLTRKYPDNAMFRYHYAAALLRSGKKPEAKLELQNALAKKPPQPVEKDIRTLLAQTN
ncbi:MAG TPA: tetratricopeptide repeat protein [Bryobacteraceae bacterium]|nr:tetratricopeptide repeat protein [Bryobacteraceae bacterium]